MRIKISSLIAFITFFSFPLLLSAQTMTMGLKLDPSLGWIRSSAFKKGAADIVSSNQGSIKSYSVRAKAGFQMGIGGFFQYEYNEKLTILVDPTFNYFRATLTQNFQAQNQLITGGQENQTTIHSSALIKYYYVNIPIMVKYELLPYQKVFATGGVSVNVNMNPKIYSSEDSVVNTIQGSTIENTTIKHLSTQATANKFSPVSVNLNLGIGKSFLMGRYYNLDVELRYQFPLTSSSLYTNDPTYQSQTALNGVFGQAGKTAFENASGKQLKNFRSSVISLAIRYTFWTK